MTQPKYPTKTRVDIAQRIGKHLVTDGDNTVELRATLTFASTELYLQRYHGDWHWLRAHRAQTDTDNVAALRVLALRLIERLHIEIGAEPVSRNHHDEVVASMAERIAQLERKLEIAEAKSEQAAARPTCHHPYSMYGQCVDCGITWSARAEATCSAVRA
ncbi:hypothetical protein ACFWPK_33155 [Nocardia sp. NPDC058519]|uniref:hypothetical protein n=1 Tax=Nocardia sp. NPDC058519 TaxID=3346535 RepID=UPI0036507923